MKALIPSNFELFHSPFHISIASLDILKPEIMKSLKSLFEEPQIEDMRYIEEFRTPRAKPASSFLSFQKANRMDNDIQVKSDVNLKDLIPYPWFISPASLYNDPGAIDAKKFDISVQQRSESMVENVTGFWTWPYFRCNTDRAEAEVGEINEDPPGRWMVSYSVAFKINER